MTAILPDDDHNATLVGRVWRPGIGPCVVAVRCGAVVDITSKEFPTVRDLIEHDHAAAIIRSIAGETVADAEELFAMTREADGDMEKLHLLAPCDLQSVKACGVTFAKSMIERVIEEKADGDPAYAGKIREKCTRIIGEQISDLVPGSPKAAEVKKALMEEGIWSQYLEVGIGPDAEVFTKAQPMSSVGSGASVGLHPESRWNNPEPEVVLAVDSKGAIKGAALGNDVNLRDVEGRSALLLGKAKDNNAACAIGPFIRLFDDKFSLDHVRNAVLTLTVTGLDGYVLEGSSSMSEISRDPADLVSQTIGTHHQYPDGVMLFLGTMFAPVKDRDHPGEGFTHKIGDRVEIACAELGTLENTVRLSTQCRPWAFGIASLMRNLSARNLV